MTVDAPYIYQATVVSVHDADTFDASISLGFFLSLTVPIRILGINAPELNTPAGKGAAAFLTGLLPAGTKILLASEKPDKYAPRVLARVMLAGQDIAETLISQQWAAAWNGAGIKPLPPWPRTVP